MIDNPNVKYEGLAKLTILFKEIVVKKIEISGRHRKDSVVYLGGGEPIEPRG
jgi:hypothetical protein